MKRKEIIHHNSGNPRGFENASENPVTRIEKNHSNSVICSCSIISGRFRNVDTRVCVCVNQAGQQPRASLRPPGSAAARRHRALGVFHHRRTKTEGRSGNGGNRRRSSEEASEQPTGGGRGNGDGLGGSCTLTQPDVRQRRITQLRVSALDPGPPPALLI